MGHLDAEASLAARSAGAAAQGEDAAAAIAATRQGAAAGSGNPRVDNVRLALGDARYHRWCRGLDCGTFWSAHDTAVDDADEAAGRAGPPGSLSARGTGGAAAGAAGAAGGDEDDEDDDGGPAGAASDPAAREALRRAEAIAKAAAATAAAPTAEAMLDTAERTAGEAENEGFRGHVASMRGLLERARPLWSRPHARREAREAAGATMTRRWLRAGRRREARHAPDGRVLDAALDGLVRAFSLHDSAFGRTVGEGFARRRDHRRVHPRLPDPTDDGSIASFVLGRRVRLNYGGPPDGHTALHGAVRHGRAEVAMLLLTHHDPALLANGDVPPLPPRPRRDGDDARADPAREMPPPEPFRTSADAPPASTAEDDAMAAAGWGGDCEAAVPPSVRAMVLDKRPRADPDKHPAGQATPLCDACARGDSRVVSLLVHFGADLNLAGFKDQTPLLSAALAGHDHVLSILLKAGLPPRKAAAVEEEIARIRESYASRRRQIRGEADPDAAGEEEDGGGGAAGGGAPDVLGDAAASVQAAKADLDAALLGGGRGSSVPSRSPTDDGGEDSDGEEDGFTPDPSSPSAVGGRASRAKRALLEEWEECKTRGAGERMLAGRGASSRVSAVPALRRVLGMVEAQRAAERASRAAEDLPTALVESVSADDAEALAA